MRRSWLVLLAIVLGVGRLAAQQLRVAIRDSASSAPLPGAVATIFDSAGMVITRGITGADGRFTIEVPLRAARMRVIRIGFHPRDVAVPPLAGRADVLQLAMGRIPPMLEAVRVTDNELCPGSADRGAAFDLWEQARAGLLATVVARELKPATVTTLVYETGLSPDDERVVRQKKKFTMGQTTRPFVASATPSFFARYGYMLEDNTGRTFNAPDADVLIDESFASTHCFHLQAADAEHAGQVGLAFVPVTSHGRDTLVEVQGTIWIDRQTPQLRSLDFRYTSLEPAAVRARAGGLIEFQTMENGVAFIPRWHLRLPTLQTVPRGQAMSGRPVSQQSARRSERGDLRVAEITNAGGMVMDAKWSDGAHWSEPPATITGVVTQKESGEPVPYGIVTLSGTADTARTSAQGDFRLAVIPGKYLLSASDTTLSDFVDARSESTPVEVARGANVAVKLAVAPMRGVIDDICRGQKLRKGTAILIGHLTSTESVPGSARVRATWQADFAQTMGGTVLTIEEEKQEASIDRDGKFVVCGVARERPIRLKLLDKDNLLGDTTVKVLSKTLEVPVEWRLSRTRADASIAVAATADTLSRALRGFEERRRRGQGRFLSDSVLRSNEKRQLADVLVTHLPGLRIDRFGDRSSVASTRDRRTGSFEILSASGNACYVTLYLDGLVLYDGVTTGANQPPPDINQFSVEQLVGVEFYAAQTAVPIQFKSSDCGTLVLWSREQ